MRLTCPNCSARYEVDESMIPVGGREVQCSNCSSTWFQPGPRPPEAAPDPARAPAPEPTPTPEVGTPPVAEEAEAARPLSEVDVDPPQDDPNRPPRRQIDPDVADILREEAEREARLRRQEPAPEPVETQDEMPLEAGERPTRARDLADLDEAAEDAFDTDEIAAAVAAANAGSRRELLPDIEEINSTLRATDDRSAAEADATDIDTVETEVRRRSKVRTGFFLILLIAAIGVGLYAYSDEMAGAVPQAAPYLDMYVTQIDQARFWLDDLARSIAEGSAGSDG